MLNAPGHMNRRKFLRDSSLLMQGTMLMSHAAGVYGAEQRGTGGIIGTWLDDTWCQLHLDSHFGGFKSIYDDFNAERAANLCSEAGFDMVSYFSKCWAGYSYYPTRYGVVHPGCKRDFTGEFSDALKKRGIKRVVYFMLGLERRLQKEHPDWIYNRDGTRTTPPPEEIGDNAIMCFRSPYVDEVGIPQMIEIVKKYDIDGFFVDIVQHQFMEWRCYCPYCRESYAREVGGDMPERIDDTNAQAFRHWQNRHMEAHMKKVYDALTKIKPELVVINNYTWMTKYPKNPPSHVHHVCWDTPPPKVGNYSWNISFETRYLSSLNGVTWSCMNTRGNNWGDYALREPEAFLSECAILLAGCGRTYLSDIPYPSGNLDPAVMKVFGRVNERTRAVKPFVRDCSPVRDVAVLHSADSIWSKSPLIPTPTWTPGPAYHDVCGAHKALVEGHVQMQIINSETMLSSLDGYRVLVLPDQRVLSDAECDAIRVFVRNGGILFVTGATGTRDAENRQLGNSNIADVLGIDILDQSMTSTGYLRVDHDIDSKIPVMNVMVAGPYCRIKATTAEELLLIVPPYEDIAGGTPPPAAEPTGPGVTVNRYGNGTAIYCATSIFGAYYTESTPVLRHLILWMLGQAYPEELRTIHMVGTPINVEMFYNKRGDERFVHLVNYAGDKRESGVPQTQDFPVIHDITVTLKLGISPRSIRRVPDNTEVKYTYRDGSLSFTALPLGTHDIYRIV